MCLYSSTNIPSIAQEDIYCYKEFSKGSIPSEKYIITPYQRIMIPVSLLPFMLEAIGNKWIRVEYGDRKLYMIGEGFIHAYAKNQWIVDYITCYKNDSAYKHSYSLVLCKIPKGSKYYKSFDRIEICAERMEIIRKII